MKEKKIETLLYSTIGVVFMFLVVVGINLIFSPVHLRVDMTEDKLYTLSPGTKKILKQIDSPIEMRFYCSQGEKTMPSQLRPFAKSAEDLLEEFRQQNPKNIVIKKFDPEPDTEAEDLARLDGIEPRNLQSGETFYLGIAVSLDPVKVALPLTPERERLLEYDIARAISRVMSTNKPVVGLMTSLPVNGMPANQMMMQRGMQGKPPWIVIRELKRDFEVETVPVDTEAIGDNIQVLIVIHPKEISDQAQFAIDQFVLRGGKLVAFLDPLCLVDESARQGPMGMNMGGGSSLPKLLAAWGLKFDTSKVVADLGFMKGDLAGPNGQRRLEPTWLFVNPKGIDREDAIMSQFDNILMVAAGAFSGTPVEGLKMESLIHSTPDSQAVETFMAQGGGQNIINKFARSGQEMNLAVRLSGKFKTAFPEGKPADDAKDEKDKKTDTASATNYLKAAKAENVVYLIGDADMLYDNFCVRKLPFFGLAQPFNGNLSFVQSITEQMAGDVNLIGARSRASIRRPFTVVEEIRAEAQKQFQAEIARFEKERQEAQQKISEIQSKKEGNQRFILSPEAAAELASLQQKQAQAGRNLREVRKALRKKEQALENELKWLNIAGMPVVVTLLGLGLAFVRKRKTVAR